MAAQRLSDGGDDVGDDGVVQRVEKDAGDNGEDDEDPADASDGPLEGRGRVRAGWMALDVAAIGAVGAVN